MARRNGRKGEWLVTDDYTGFTRYASQVTEDYWGALTVKPLLRNLQEISSPLSDPEPVPYFRGSNYEQSNGCLTDSAPAFVGNTNVPTSQNNAAYQAFINVGIGDMAVGCNFIVR